MRQSFGEYVANFSVRKRFRSFVGHVDELIWPKRSLVSGRPISGPGLIEAEHWKDLQFLTGQLCASCGLPFELDVGEDQICPACIAHPPKYDRARAAVTYNDASRKLILRLKHSGDRTGLVMMASWMQQAMPDLINQADLIMPVPLHYTRLVERGFNQSLWLAAALGRASGKPLLHHGLKRMRATPSQAGRSASGRRRNVQGAFSMSGRAVRRVKDRRVLLVDDVYTTGATVNACAQVVKRAGAVSVDVTTVMRVVRATDPTI